MACLVCLLCSSGCAVPYVYPKLDFTQSLQLDVPSGEARVFRVDVVRTKAPGVRHAMERLSEVPVADSSQVATQFKPSAHRGIYLFMGALNYDFQASSSLELRAYRPGFELVTIHPGEQIEQIAWTPAPDLAAQERTLDSLLPQKRGDSSELVSLDKGSCSTAHRNALVFGAEEYERLSALVVLTAAQTRLTNKAHSLRKLAAE